MSGSDGVDAVVGMEGAGAGLGPIPGVPGRPGGVMVDGLVTGAAAPVVVVVVDVDAGKGAGAAFGNGAFGFGRE